MNWLQRLFLYEEPCAECGGKMHRMFDMGWMCASCTIIGARDAARKKDEECRRRLQRIDRFLDEQENK